MKYQFICDKCKHIIEFENKNSIPVCPNCNIEMRRYIGSINTYSDSEGIEEEKDIKDIMQREDPSQQIDTWRQVHFMKNEKIDYLMSQAATDGFKNSKDEAANDPCRFDKD